MQKYNNITEILDKMTTDKDGVKRLFANIGSDENDYASFKNRYKMFKEIIANELPEFTHEEILKYNKHYSALQNIYKWCGFDILLKILEWETLKNKEDGEI